MDYKNITKLLTEKCYYIQSDIYLNGKLYYPSAKITNLTVDRNGKDTILFIEQFLDDVIHLITNENKIISFENNKMAHLILKDI